MSFDLPKLIGHRGVKDIAPENTIESIIQATKFNLKWVEVDVKISRDKIPFLLHDSNLKRTTSGNGNPVKFYYKEIKKLNAGLWFNKKYNDLYPPTLEEIINICLKKNIGINIELKPNKNFERENVLAISKLFKKYKYTFQYFFSSFDWFSSILIKKLLPESQVGILVDNFKNKKDIDDILKKCLQNNFFSCGFNSKIISKETILLFKNHGIKVTVYSSKSISIEKALKLWNQGVDSIFIDNPMPYRKILLKT